MKIFVEQIIIDQGILIYSNFFKYTDSPDEEGNDFEYDFESIYANVDNIQTTILKLYGTQGLIQIFGYFAEGKNDLLSFEAIEFEESSPLREMVSNIVQNLDKVDLMPVDERQVIQPVIEINRKEQPSDSIFLLNGLLAGLPHNEDLNVMKMLGQTYVELNEDVSARCMAFARNFGIDEDATLLPFTFDNVTKILVVGKHSFIQVILDAQNVVLDFPSNEIQEKTLLLFNKYIDIIDVTKLKRSVILETRFNSLANAETTESLRDYLVLYNVENAKFESKENRLTV